MPHRRAATAAALALLVLGWLLSGCSGSGEEGPGAEPTSSTGSSTGSSEQPSALSSPSRTDPLAPATVAPVIRDGETPHPSISAQPQPFDEPVAYPDGVSLEVIAIDQGEVTDRGPGVIAGPTTAFTIELTNGSKTPLDLNAVTVTTVYGDPARISRPVYDQRSQDFAGKVRGGGTAEAHYVFSIPTDQLGDVTVHVDFDGRHTAAQFTGAAR